MSTDVNKLAEEYADEVRWVPPSMSVDELKNEMVKAHQAGFRAALTCQEVNEGWGTAKLVEFIQNSRGYPTPKEWDEIVVIAKRTREALDRLLEGVKA